jgi:hypothetical protein
LSKVRCPGCAADISPLREFCPQCGTATDAGLRESRLNRHDERSPDELSRNRKTVLTIGAVVLIIAVALGRIHPFGHHLSFSPGAIHIETGKVDKGPVTVGAQQLYQAYRDDPEAAERHFGGREIVVSGEFLRTVPDGYGSIDMRLKTSNPEVPLGVDLDRASVDEATTLEQGQSVTVSCRRVARTGDERWLQDCLIQTPAAPGAGTSRPSAVAPAVRTAESNSG